MSWGSYEYWWLISKHRRLTVKKKAAELALRKRRSWGIPEARGRNGGLADLPEQNLHVLKFRYGSKVLIPILGWSKLVKGWLPYLTGWPIASFWAIPNYSEPSGIPIVQNPNPLLLQWTDELNHLSLKISGVERVKVTCECTAYS
jgi:hypothetical protein